MKRKKQRNLRKAAILFSSLEPQRAETLLAQMSGEQAAALRQAIERLGDIDPAERYDVIEEFFRIGPLVPEKQPSGIELDRELPSHLSIAPAGDAAKSPHEAGAANTPFRCLHEAAPRWLARFLEREHPQTIAVVISQSPPERAAEILSALSADLQIDVARRLVDLDETDPEILREVERGLESWLEQQSRGDERRTAGMTALNKILHAANPATKQHILANLSRHDRQSAARQKKAAPAPALTFADLEKLDRASLTVVLHHAEPELLVLALAGSSGEFAARVFDLFPPEETLALRESLRDLGPTRLSDVEEAQRELTELARQLELRGDIVPDVRGRLSVAV